MTQPRLRIIGCEVFKPALEFLRIPQQYPHVSLTFLPCNLHVNPAKLRVRLEREILQAQKNEERAVCLYGVCFPEIEAFCRAQGAVWLATSSCFEAFIGKHRYASIMEEEAGTYFAERELIINFEEYCLEPLELFDPEMRRLFFKHYKKLVYIRQPSDPHLLHKARKLADFLELSLEVIDADYAYLQQRLRELL